MSPASPREIRFVRALLPDNHAKLGDDGLFRTTGDRAATLPAARVAALRSAGVLGGDAEGCTPAAEARSWLRRQLVAEDPHAVQHRRDVRRPDGTLVNLAESPLSRLGGVGGSEAPFLSPHQVEAGERVRKLIERAQLRARVTMSYDAAHTAAKGGGAAAEMSDIAADARRQLAAIARVLPRDCVDVVLDVCGFEKGLQLIETERGWPRRSAKLVLRIGLDQLAEHFGLAGAAIGRERGVGRAWMEEGARPAMFGD